MPQKKRQYVDTHELRTLAEQAPDGYFLHDIHGRIIDVNRRACDSLGYTREDLLQLTVFDFERDIDQAAAQRVWTAMVPGEGITLAGRHRRKDGTEFPIEARISLCLVQDERLYLVLVRDLTERQIAEHALRASAQQYQTLFNSIDEGFCVIEILFDPAGQPDNYRFLEVNPAFEKHVGLLGAPGHTIRDLVPNIERKWIDIYGQVALTGQSARFRESSPSLQQSSFDVYAFRLGPHGSPRVAILFSNITQRLAAEEALKKSERLALIGQMAGVISHEINNPLDAIQNLLYMADFEDDRAICREYIRSAQKEVASAARIVSNTLKFTRRAEDATREKLSDILDSALTLLDAKRKRAAITVERDYRPQAELLCLSSELRQVFANLLTNAFEASFDNAKVHVRARNSAHWHTGHPGVRLTIADNGSGMSPDTKKNLYQAFYTTKGTNGTGLGLWVSHEILARHGATLQVRSRQAPHHSGTVLQLFFPVDTQPKTTATPTTQAQPKASATT